MWFSSYHLTLVTLGKSLILSKPQFQLLRKHE